MALEKRAIPSSGEMLPVVGLGTWQTFDVADTPEKAKLAEVLSALVRHGATVVDSSPMYGRSQQVVGELSEKLKINQQLFIATKVWTSGKQDGIRQMKESMGELRRNSVDLMQVHNLTDWRTHLATLREWKESGVIRYLGITHYTERAYEEIEKILMEHPVDFLQINYSLASRKAAERLFPLAQEKQVAVLINRPFEEGSLFRHVKGKQLPGWAIDAGCDSWGQVFVKFILAQPAVTCVIPGTSKVEHLVDNLKAGIPPFPDAALQQKMLALLE